MISAMHANQDSVLFLEKENKNIKRFVQLRTQKPNTNAITFEAAYSIREHEFIAHTCTCISWHCPPVSLI